ncbi:helicase-exonuclease AddAB subunit AddA [uncultured Eubacterium sp.]|mgnify:CR=1 FL=1|uniref:helicase-exonuclease AddAB subunit AddA n=1 Tax=uncultured Eubacterium sp. TaxID=165185 RepID=UPI0015B2F46F|nr:helicase-exonuclease AddAB subunit AddA [uncultured Eubacterium sp.]
MSVKWTKEQEKVINLRNRSLLVSAAAGSGKTAVLVQRIISMVTDKAEPLDIDRLLVVTFTNAAAAEMRERVGVAIENALEQEPYNQHLQRQLTLVHNAQITTIDSFCIRILRDHFHKIDLEPGFRIADEGELKLLREDVCEAVLEEFYQKADPEFFRFADSYSGAKNDLQIKEMILKLYNYAESYPWPKEWLETCVQQYEAANEAELEEKSWIRDFLSYLDVRIEDLITAQKKLLELTQEPDGPYMYEASIADDLRQLENLRKCEHFSQWQEAVSSIDFKNIGRSGKYEGSVAKKNAVMSGRKRMKDQIDKWKKTIFATPLEVQLERLTQTSKMVRVLVTLTQAFSDRFYEEKQKKNMLDFSDVEHNALRVLVNPETKELTETALEYQQQYREVMIDEYQDSNYVQETLLTAVSGVKNGNENLFMVGDVKQSIYRFRLARPELFMDKYHRFSTEESSRQRIDLHRNFRSRREVVEAVNDIFYPLMEKDLGNVAYDAEAALYAGAEYPDYENADCCKPEFLLVPSQESGMERREQEAAAVAGRIRELVETQEIPGITYKDIVLLLRSMSGWAETYQKVFEQEGIPLIVASKTGYFSATEVQTVLSLLRVLDNPYQDIPMAAVMKSYFGKFTSEELAQIRAESPGMPFYQCVEQFTSSEEQQKEEQIADTNVVEAEKQQKEEPISDTDAVEAEILPQEKENENVSDQRSHLAEKIIAFQEMLQNFRQRIPYTPIHRLLQEILDETGYRNYVAALPAGEQRRANLDMLMEKAVAYEQTSYHGLFHFIRYIDRLMKYDVDYGEAEIVSEQENAVRLMSIHKSKGLEFPVVFVCGMGKQFNEQDLNSNMIFHPEFGIGLKWFDCEKRTKANTLIHQIFAMEAKKENLGEELRVLYVALTRAKEKLILAGTCKLPEEGQYSGFSREEKVSFSTRYDAKSYWDWVMPVLGMENPDYRYVIWDEARMQQEEQRKLQDTALEHRTLLVALQNVSEIELTQLKETFSWEYAWKEEGTHKQKVSVSELKHRAMEERSESAEQTLNTAQPLFPDEIATPYVPRFVQEAKENAGALYGTMVHRFLECLDFAGLPDFAEEKQGLYFVKQQIDALCALGRMQEADAKRLNWKQLLGFLQSDTAKRMRVAAEQGTLEREKPFVMSVPANLVWEESRPEEEVLIQGIIDVFWEEADGIVLLDYKTDHVDNAQELVHRYKKQLELYADALSRFSGEKPVKEILIYSFALAETIRL